STASQQRPVLGLEALAQVPNFPWKKAWELLPGAMRKTKEERQAENTAIFERAGARSETAGKLAELYDWHVGNVGSFVGGLLGGALGGRLIAPSPKAPYVGLKNPFSSVPEPPVPASIPRPFVNSGGTVVVEDELMARGTFEIRVLDPFKLDAEALQLGRGHVLQGVSNPRATVLANFMKP